MWLLICLFLLVSHHLQAQRSYRSDLCFVWYNVENLFYPDNDTLPGDDEFTPDGVRHWTWSRYRQKLTALAKVIIASGRGDPPELVGLCEVENELVLKELVTHPILAPFHYDYLHREGSDHRGMEVACLIRSGKFDTVQFENLSFGFPVTSTRDIMHITLCRGGDTLDLFLVHLLSKFSGAGSTAELRRIQAQQLVQAMDSLYTDRSNGLIMAAGDFNDEYGAYSLEPLKNARFKGDTLRPLHQDTEPGTYKYRGRWSPIDQVLSIQSLDRYTFAVNSLQLPSLLIADPEYGGVKPRRTYEGYLYTGGVSDHLPLVVDLSISPHRSPAGQ